MAAASIYPQLSDHSSPIIALTPIAQSPAVLEGVRKRRTPSEEATAVATMTTTVTTNRNHHQHPQSMENGGSYTNRAYIGSSIDLASSTAAAGMDSPPQLPLPPPIAASSPRPPSAFDRTHSTTTASAKVADSSFWSRWKRSSACGRLTNLADMIKNAHTLQKTFATCCLFGRKRKFASQHRTVIPNHLLQDHHSKSHPNRRYSGNKVKTTKYTVLTFIPKNLFEQFHRFANLYFVFIAALNWLPQVEAIGKELSMIPVLFVLAVTAVKDIFEDRRRYLSDRKVNHATCRVFNCHERRYVKTEWKDVLVGDFVHLSCNEIIPADILLVRSSDPTGVCYVKTSNLDGETNLKQRYVIASIMDQPPASFTPVDFKSTVECEPPNNQIYKFTGFLLHQDGQRETVSKSNLLLRGCEVRNTDYIEGIVVYAGHETKAMLNNSGPRYKRSKLERLMNWDIVWCVVVLLLMCFAGALGGGVWMSTFDDPTIVPYLLLHDSTKAINRELEGFLLFWTYIIILQVMIPISLYVTIELVKLGQIFFITQDPLLYYAPAKKRIQCRALNIPEELGQIEYVMSDKTGTLTENQMIFRRCAVAGIDYGPTDTNMNREQVDFASSQATKETSKDVRPNVQLQHLMVTTASEEVADYQLTVDRARRTTLFDFFVNMAVCNTVVVNPHQHSDRMNASGYVNDESESGSGSHSGHHHEFSAFSDTANSFRYVDSNGNGTNDGNGGGGGGLLKIAPLSASTPVGQTPLDPPTPRHGSLSDLNKKNGRLAATAPAASLPQIVTTATTDSMTMSASGYSSEDDILDGKKEDASKSADISEQQKKSRRPSTLALGKKLLQLPALAKQHLPPLVGRKSQGPTPSVSPGYRNPVYEAESPDELALVYASAAYGFRLVKRHTNSITVELPNGDLFKFQILHILPFDSVRKRMSVIVRHPKSKKIILYCKGADSSVMEALAQPFCESQRGQMYVYKSQEYLNLYASYGLRTLCLAKRELSPEEYEKWAAQHEDAEMSLDEDREQMIFDSAVRIEKDMELLGVSGIEDRLQEGVADCIAALRHAGIKVWVLTGDKIETAVNIAYACKLFVYGMELIQLCTRDEADAETLLQHHLDRLTRRNLDSDDGGTGQRADNLAVVVDGQTLAYFLTPKLEEKFVQIVSRCTSVLCCRATPLQKASVVRLVKEKLEGTTLAVGDGANDVSMIQCADVGVGISGQEGMQAVMASDFAMPQFRFLQRLLLVHGHWCYDRLARMVLYFFYKNAMFVFTLFWYQFFCGFTAQVLIDQLYLMLHNLVFTSLSPLLLGVFDQDAPAELLFEHPELYLQGPKALLYRTHSFWLNVLDAFWQSIVCYFVPHMMYQESSISLSQFGYLVASALVLCNVLHLLINLRSWTFPIVASAILSVLVFYGFSLAYNALALTCCGGDTPYMVAQMMMKDPVYWLGLLLIVVLALFPRFVCLVMSNTLLPTDVFRARLRLREKRRKANQGRILPLVARFTNRPTSVSFVQPSAPAAAPGTAAPNTTFSSGESLDA